MNISIIVPCRNEARHIREFLDSVLSQKVPPEWSLEILVTDGRSDDATREILDEYSRRDERVRMVDNPGRIVSTGLNAAIGEARGDIIIRMDAHTTYASDYVHECVTALIESGSDNVGGPWIARGQSLWGNAIAAAFRSRFCCGGGRAHDPTYEGEVDTVYLGCWPRALFKKVGVFDPDLVRNQDDELNFRIRRLGGKIWQSPRIKSLYVVRSSLKLLFRQYLQYGFWKVAVIRKHKSLASWRHIIPALFISSVVLLTVASAGVALLGWHDLARAVGAAAAIEVLLYALASITAAASFAGSVPETTLAMLPVVFAVYHVAYGLGFIFGVFHRNSSTSMATRELPPFTELTR